MQKTDPSSPTNGWVDGYQHLLKESGMSVCEVLAEANQRGTPRRDGVLSLAQCLAQPRLFIAQVQRDYPQATDPKILRAYLTVLQQDLALSVIAPLVARLFSDGQTRLLDPQQIFLAPLARPGQTSSRWFQVPDGPSLDETKLIAHAGAQTTAWYDMFRQHLRVSPGAYWSSIGLGLGAPFSAVWNLVEPRALCRLAQPWLEQFRNDSNRFIDWIPARFADQDTAIPQRKGCCLKYLLPGEGYCGTCGVYRKERMAALNRQ